MANGNGTDFTDKQARFIEEYCKDFNATGAARRAGYSEKTAETTGFENIRKPKIRDAIDARLKEMTMTADEILQRLGEIARAGYSEHLTTAGPDIQKILDDGYAYLVKGLKYNTSGKPVWEFHDPVKAMELLGKHYKLFTDRQEIEQTVHITGLEEALSRIYGNDND